MNWEVPTMKSRTSLFNPALFRSNLRRFAPLWGMMLGFLILICPANFLNEVLSHLRAPVLQPTADFLREQTEMLGVMNGVLSGINIVYGALCAVFCFKYLHAERGVYTMHALPLTRDCHYVTNLVSGLFFCLLPALVACVLSMAVYGAMGAAFLAPVLKLFGLYVLQFLCFYGFGVFCMMLSGRTVIAVLSYIALIFIGYALPAMTRSLLVEPLFVGLGPMGKLPQYLSPALDLTQDSLNAVGSLSVAAHTAIWAAVGLGLMGLSWFLYRRRHLERVGDAMVFGWARWAFQLLFAWLAGLLLGSFIYLVLTGTSLERTHWTWFLVAMLVGLFVSWFAARMMLERTIHVLRSRKNWLGYGAFALAAAALILCLRYDVLGWQRWVPDVNEVEAVELSDNAVLLIDSGYTTAPAKVTVADPAMVERVLALHRELYEENKDFEENYMMNSLTLNYKLKNGRTVTRSYSLDNGKSGKTLDGLYRDAEVSTSFFRSLLSSSILEASLEYYEERPDRPMSSSLVNPDAVRAAILADAEAGKLPIHRFYGGDEECDAVLILIFGGSLHRVEIPLNTGKDAPSVLALFSDGAQAEGGAK